MAPKVKATVGYSRSGNIAHDYKYAPGLASGVVGLDVTAEDTRGNKIELIVRERGYRITLNGVDIAVDLGGS